ncbi:Vacuolar protein sorting-associated protein 5 [Podila minutissima]|uniref:Vacuolar protein sorting-associated protein 5 n=1 Tax=Podila minutissima TaxID=64525 RepID=A0A9P5SNV9_9FUNG|nr:Vacuolar protein sorting-associated protein 5 [Podila minutissima]
MTSSTGSVSDLIATGTGGSGTSDTLDASTFIDPFSESNPFAEDAPSSTISPHLRASQSLNFHEYYPQPSTSEGDDTTGSGSLYNSISFHKSFSAMNLAGNTQYDATGPSSFYGETGAFSSTPMSLRLPENGALPWFEITVGEPQKVGDAINAYIVYKVHIKTNSTAFKSNDFTVQRRYRDFLWLYNQLTAHNPGVIVPPVSEKHALGRFQDEFVESRRIALERCLRKMTAHPMLYGDPDLKLFLESDSLVAEIKEKRQDNSKGFMTKFGETLSSATTFTKVHETDEWFESRRTQLDVLDSQLKSLLKAIEAIIKQRKDLGLASSEFGESIVSLAGTELNKPLANSLLVLGNLKIRIKELHDKQAHMDVLTLEHTVDEYIRTIGSIKIAFMARAKFNQNMVQAQNDLSKKKANFDKMNQPSRKTKPEKIQQLQQEITEAEQRVDASKREFEEISSLIRQEFDRFDREKVEDFKHSVEAFLASMVKHQREIVGLWENYFKALNGSSEEPRESQDQAQPSSEVETTEPVQNTPLDETLPVRSNDILSANAWSG